MPIPRVLYQTYVSKAALPLTTRLYIRRMLRFCQGYDYEFFDDRRIERFLEDDYEPGVLEAYKRIAIGAAKADFFRYAILLKRGGVYLDVDSSIEKDLDGLVRPDDEAVISRERNPGLYVQWALVYAPGHPFLWRTLAKVVDNIRTNRYPDDVHRMTGPTAYSEAIKECLAAPAAGLRYRDAGVDYEGYFRYKHPWARLMYLRKPNWRIDQKKRKVLAGHPGR